MLYFKVMTALPRPIAGRSLGPFVFLDLERGGSDDVVVHEEQHVRQWYLMSALLLPLLATFFWPALPLALLAHVGVAFGIPGGRAFFEADALAAEVRHGTTSLDVAARDLQFCYETGWSRRRAREIIRELSRGAPHGA